MFSGVELIFNAMWFGMLIVGTVIVIMIMRKRDPIDDGPELEEDDE
ncbi:MAG TPA: hypothetical protein VFV52_08040 [Bacilli bacterium]|nr:hypothetical protein [Bacilli bacterium]